jgi:CRISPR-associated protein Csx14
MGRAVIPVDLRNPGQVFACLGFLEAADLLAGPAEGGFDWTDNEVFVLESEGAENPVEDVLAFLFEAEARAVAPFGSALQAKEAGVPTEVAAAQTYPCAEPATASALPTVLVGSDGRSLRLEHWADGTRQRDTVKFWAGMGGYSGAALTRDLLAQLAAFPAAARARAAAAPFDLSTRQSSSFRFDSRGSYVPLDLGFSLNEHSEMRVAGYPIVELLAAIGLQNARPRLTNKLLYEYGAWGVPLPVQLARACLGASLPSIPNRRFLMHLGWPGTEGKARCILFAEESTYG